jgi:hypothetical protein
VSFFDATNYCVMRTLQDFAAGRIPPGTHYRLPTEAEWEYAARAGTSTRFSFGDDLNETQLANNGWFINNGGNMTHPVGLKAPNPWGLYDMAGNVYEWCSDWYGPYPGGFATDPQGPASNAIGVKVIRGGSWVFGWCWRLISDDTTCLYSAPVGISKTSKTFPLNRKFNWNSKKVQNDSAAKPTVGTKELPWVNDARDSSTPTGLRPLSLLHFHIEQRGSLS